MKVICIDAYAFTGLTYGKVYDEVESEGNDRFICIINNNGLKASYLRSSFISLEEFREKQLSKLGIV